MDQGKLTGMTTSTILGIETLKVSGSKGEAFAHWAGHQGAREHEAASLGAINAIAGVAPNSQRVRRHRGADGGRIPGDGRWR